MKRLTSLITLLITGVFLFIINAQTTEIDSLENLLQTHTSADTIRVNLLNETAKKLSRVNGDKSLEYAKESEILASELNYLKGKANSLQLIGVYHFYKSDHDISLEYLNKSVKLFEKLENEKGVSNCLNIIGLIYKMQTNYPKALEYFEKSLEIAKKSKNKDGIANCLNNMGAIYSNMGDFTKALEYYQNASGIFEELGDNMGLASCFNNIGIIFKSQDNYSLALEYYKKTLAIGNELGDKRVISYCLNNIGIVYKNKGNYSMAMEYYQKALKIMQESKNKKGIAASLNNIGGVYSKQANYSKAIEYFKKSIKIEEEIGNSSGVCYSFTNIGDVYLQTNNYANALNYSLKGLKIANELNLLENQIEIHEQLSKIYSATKNYKKAYENHLLFKELSDSIFNEKNIKKTISLELQYKYEKEKKVAELEQQKKDAVTQKEIKYQKTIKNVFVAGLFVAVLIILLFYRIVRIKKKANKLLNLKNKEILGQKDLISEQKSEIQIQAEELAEHKEILEKTVKQRTADLIIAKEQAEESGQLKTAFLNNISHEFRTPMNGILGFTQLLINSESTEKQDRYADIVNKSCTQLLSIVNDTVEISKVHSRQAKIYKSLINISSLVSETVNEFRKIALLKRIDIILEQKLKKVQLLIYTDKNKIKRILWHLIDNAVKFTHQGVISVSVQVINNYIQFQITDTGIGIPPEFHKKIFDPFRQVETGLARNFGGNGIGLSLAKAYIELLGGKIWLESEIDKGTTVFFTIPIEQSINKEIEKQTITTGEINNKIILIAEDNELNYLLVREIFFNYNIKLLRAWNGKEAVEIFTQEKRMDLILMDLKMPIMDGYEALKQIKSINPQIPVIAQTAYASDTDLEEIKSAGFDAFITKPISEDKLVQMIKQRL